MAYHTIDKANVRRVEVQEMINLGLQRLPLEEKAESTTSRRAKVESE